MNIALKKFGTVLTSRQLGKESFAAFLPSLKGLSDDETVEIDFEGVSTFSPSWGDEFLTRLREEHQGKILFKNTENPSVKETLKFLEQVNNKSFDIQR